MLHGDSILITVNPSRHGIIGSTDKKQEVEQGSIWKQVTGLFYILLYIRYIEKCFRHFLQTCWAMARKVKVNSKCSVVLVLNCGMKAELLREHPLHSLLKHSPGSTPRCIFTWSYSSAALLLGEVTDIRYWSLSHVFSVEHCKVKFLCFCFHLLQQDLLN